MATTQRTETAVPAGPLSAAQLARYREDGHLTVPGVFKAEEVAAALADLEAWSAAELKRMSPAERAWYVDRGVPGLPVLRKLDQPVARRPLFRQLAAKPSLLAMVEQLIGPGLVVYFSQVFFKPPGGGGPKPVHQDNFYFGPNAPDGLVTVWLALDDATVENGCLHYADGSNRGPVLAHEAPADRPFDLQIPEDVAAGFAMTPAPVPRGGISFHHGNTLHQSADNNSSRWRRACAMHYVSAGTRFVNPALDYDDSLVVAVP